MNWLERLLGALYDARVEFIVVGGIAARAHGASRLTQDVDVSYSRSADNLERIVAALAPLEPYLRGAPRGLPFEWSMETLRRGINFTLTTTTGDIDLLGEIVGGGTYEDLLPHTLVVSAFGSEIRILDLPWLIHVKRAAGRPKDLEAIAELEALQEEIEGEAKTHLSRLVDEAAAGAEIVIAKSGTAKARLVPLEKPRRARTPGGWEGRIRIAEDFDDELPPEVLTGFMADEDTSE